MGQGARGTAWQGAVGKRGREAGSEQGLRAGGRPFSRVRLLVAEHRPEFCLLKKSAKS